MLESDRPPQLPSAGPVPLSSCRVLLQPLPAAKRKQTDLENRPLGQDDGDRGKQESGGTRKGDSSGVAGSAGNSAGEGKGGPNASPRARCVRCGWVMKAICSTVVLLILRQARLLLSASLVIPVCDCYRCSCWQVIFCIVVWALYQACAKSGLWYVFLYVCVLFCAVGCLTLRVVTCVCFCFAFCTLSHRPLPVFCAVFGSCV